MQWKSMIGNVKVALSSSSPISQQIITGAWIHGQLHGKKDWTKVQSLKTTYTTYDLEFLITRHKSTSV